MAEKKKNEIWVSKRCPNCGWGVLDKITPTAGIIELKSPKCEKPGMIDLSFRISINSAALSKQLLAKRKPIYRATGPWPV